MCSDTTEALNSFSGMKCYGLFTMRRMCIGMIIASLVYGILGLGIYGIYVAANKETFNGTFKWIPIVVGMIVVPFFYLVFVGAIGNRLSRKYIETTLWEILKRHYKKSKWLIFYDNLPFEIFQEFVMKNLQNKYKTFADTIDEYEKWADRLIGYSIAYYSHDIIHWNDLPKSANNRHGTWKRKECICQLVEEHLSELRHGQCMWFDDLTKSETKNYSHGSITYWRTIIV